MILDKIRKIDISLLLPLLVILIEGLMALHSATLATQGVQSYFTSQIIRIIMGIIIMLLLYLSPLDWLHKMSLPIYLLGIVLLLVVIVAGYTGMGATRWIRLGFINFQPSEFAKLSTLMLLASYLGFDRRDPNKFSTFMISGLILSLPFVLIFVEPDLGTSLVLLAYFLPVLHWAGLKSIILFMIISPFFIMIASFNFIAFLVTMILILAILYVTRQKNWVLLLMFLINISIGLMTPMLWNSLKPYQQKRIKVFMQPEMDPRGSGYQIIQSKIAIGSGGFWGKGWHKGTQVQLRFLPEQHTDFIIAVIGEELGFVGIFILLTSFAILLLRILHTAKVSRNKYNQLMAVGIFIIFLFHVIVNIGMTIGIMPVTGLPLPFVSFGGSAMLLNFALVGIVLNILYSKFN